MAGKKARKPANGKPRGAARAARKPAAGPRAVPREAERDAGPRGWLLPILESAYTRLAPRGAAAAPAPAAGTTRGFVSAYQSGKGEEVLAALPHDAWRHCLSRYKMRKAAAGAPAPAAAVAPPPGAAIPGQRNWSPLGPSVVTEGQAVGNPPVGGRVAGIAVAPGGNIVYAASANGGVFRSDDGAATWRSLMDGFDLDPTNFASTSLACGAIAIDANDPNRVYVGTGEGDTYAIFKSRIVNALPAYRGIGPVRSDDGGRTWHTEPTAAGSPDLAGKAFFALAVDPSNRENVVAATTEGLYQRVLRAGGGAEWILRRPGTHSSVVVAASGSTVRFYAAQWGGGVAQSGNGSTWTGIAKGFPTSRVGRIALAVRANSLAPVYAMVVDDNGVLAGVHRNDGGSTGWRPVAGPPDVLPVDHGRSQGDYDLAIAVDPVDADVVYMGGSYFADPRYWPASVWRCAVKATPSGYRMTGTSIGTHAHADVHVLKHTPDDPNSLWMGCDGGVFLNRDPKGSGAFGARNNGLACLCTNFFAQHPTDPGILFTGLQDNGTARASGGPVWRHVTGGDGGYCLVHWADPHKVLTFANGTVYRSTNGGLASGSWTSQDFPWATMTLPIVSPPYNPASPAEANIVAVGAGGDVYVSRDFGLHWTERVSFPTADSVMSLSFASARRFYVGTTRGGVFRADYANSAWSVTRIDDAAAGPLGVDGLVSDVTADWQDPTLSSVYVAMGGAGDARRVWRFDGTRWESRSGTPGADDLLDVEHNAIVVDRAAPDHVYVGADIGVWHSPDRGRTWHPLSNGLPDAPVFDLQIHPTRRLLRASTHGRGLFEYVLSP